MLDLKKLETLETRKSIITKLSLSFDNMQSLELLRLNIRGFNRLPRRLEKRATRARVIVNGKSAKKGFIPVPFSDLSQIHPLRGYFKKSLIEWNVEMSPFFFRTRAESFMMNCFVIRSGACGCFTSRHFTMVFTFDPLRRVTYSVFNYFNISV